MKRREPDTLWIVIVPKRRVPLYTGVLFSVSALAQSV